MPKRVHKLTQKHQKAFYDAFDDLFPHFEETRATYPKAAKLIGQRIGFPELSDSTVRSHAKREGKPFTWSGRSNSAPATNASDLAALAGYVVRLYQQHGQAPDDLLALADGVPLPPALPARNGEQLF